MSGNGSQNKFQTIANITNSLSQLIPLGVLFFTALPRVPAAGIEAPDGWRWLNLPSTGVNLPLYPTSSGDLTAKSMSPMLLDLCYLHERLLVRLTYKVIASDLVAVRVYVIPNDVEGYRFLSAVRWMRGKSQRWHDIHYMTIMKKLLTVLDFSYNAWNVKSVFDLNTAFLIFDALTSFEPFSSKNLGTSTYFDNQEFEMHILRLKANQPFRLMHSDDSSSLDLESRLSRIYNSVRLEHGTPSQFYTEIENVKGLKSELYQYQKETVSRMLYLESASRNKIIPHLLEVTKAGCRRFYVNTTTLEFSLQPEYFSTPRGGILAENMGLGKTLICLALVTITRFQSSQTPEKYIINGVLDHKVLSLQEHCVRFITRNSIPWKQYTGNLPETCISALERRPGYFYLDRDVPIRRSSSRSKPNTLQEKLLLSTATLIVCPDNLFHQWVFEIKKHVEDGTLKLLEIEQNGGLPSCRDMINYDIVLISVSAYVKEDQANSELTKIYWKRLIVDEGHSMNQKLTRAVYLTKEIKVERRWAVTGTPTAGLTKLSVNETLDEQQNKEVTIKRQFNPKEDLTKLGSIVMNFFKIEPWCSNHDMWNKNIVKPLVENVRGSDFALSSFLNDIIVRHSSEQIEKDVKLPPLYHKPVFLAPSYHNKISINLFTAVLATNAVSSEREDRDYMFNPASRPDLRRLVTNLQRASFFWTGFTVEDLENMIKIAEICLDKKNEEGSVYYSEADIDLLKCSIGACELALADKIWRTVSTIHEMDYYVSLLDRIFVSDYSIGKLEGDVAVFGAPQLYSLQNFYFKNRFSTDKTLKDKIKLFSSAFWTKYWQEATKKNSDRVKKNDGQTIDLPSVTQELEKQEKITLKPAKTSRSNDPNTIKNLDGKIEVSETSSPEPLGVNGHRISSSSKDALIIGCGSSKLSYMVSRLLENQYSGIKSLVFFEFEDSAYYLSEALDIVGIKYTLYATSVPKQQRAQKIYEFTNSIGGHVLIMDINLASHGLTIIAATQVYFLNPVWRRSTEAQAIKRAHRIGQTSPVHVETLILEGTLEEEMYRKRLVSEDEQNVPVADDDQIQEYISRFEFLKMDNTMRYSEFRAPSTSGASDINTRIIEESELPEPYAKSIENNFHWTIPLFTKDAICRVSPATRKLNSDEKQEGVVGERQDTLRRKKVRFR